FLHALYAVLPHLVGDVPTSGGILRGGFGSNEVGGTLALLFPFVLALTLFQPGWWARVPLIALSALLLLPLLLSASRSAGFGVAIGVVLVVALRWPRLAVGAPIPLVALVGATLLIGPSHVPAAVVDIPNVWTM